MTCVPVSLVAVVFQAFVNYPNWTVAVNITSPMRAQGVSRRDCEARAKQLAEVLGLEALLQRLPNELSARVGDSSRHGSAGTGTGVGRTAGKP